MKQYIFLLLLTFGVITIPSSSVAPCYAKDGKLLSDVFETDKRQEQLKLQDGITSPVVHDPVIIKCEEKYYLFCTGWGISSFVSDDMKHWKPQGGVFEQIPQWMKERVPGFRGHMWAPDIIYHNGEYHLYYSCSTFGKNRSFIGHAVNKTLDRESKDYKWQDRGIVIESIPERDQWNAIDPNVIIDEQGKGWFSFGSFWGGIKLFGLDETLSKPQEPQEWITIATRDRSESKENAIEAPFIYKKGDYYYLFVSIDFCCRGKESTYKMVVGRSKSIKGPYLDDTGRAMHRGGYKSIKSSSQEWVAAGHCGVHHIDGKDFLVAHAYNSQTGNSQLIIREIVWDVDGWPDIKL